MTQAEEVGKLLREKMFIENSRKISMRIVVNCKILLLRQASVQPERLRV
jgi:hypothetical protein